LLEHGEPTNVEMADWMEHAVDYLSEVEEIGPESGQLILNKIKELRCPNT
jgi:hypothetical protein